MRGQVVHFHRTHFQYRGVYFSDPDGHFLLVLVRQLVCQHINWSDLRRTCQQLFGTRHQRSGDWAVEVRLAPGFLVESIEDRKGLCIQPHGKPDHCRGLCNSQRLRAGEELSEFLLLTWLGFQFDVQGNLSHGVILRKIWVTATGHLHHRSPIVGTVIVGLTMILDRSFYNAILMRRFLQARNANEMARPREFDEQAVLDAATQRFWVYGYEATSMRDLADDMRLTSASLYNAFGDKRTLYRRILDRYAETALLNCATVFAKHNSPPRALKQFFDSIVAEALHDPLHKGCLVVNTSLEVAPHDGQFREVVTGVLRRIEKYFHDCIAAGQLDGTITTKQPADDLARLFLGAMVGIRVLARARPDPKLLTGIAKPLLRLLRAS